MSRPIIQDNLPNKIRNLEREVSGVDQAYALGWQNLPTLQNGWTVYSGTNDAKYTIDALGYVQCRGELLSHATTGLASDSLLFTFPTGFTPIIRAYCTLHENSTAFRHCYISADGTLKLAGAVAGNAVFNLNEVRFPTF